MTENDELLLLRAMLRASDYGVLLSDSTRMDRLCNQRFCDMFGLDSIDILRSQPNYVRAELAPRLKDGDGFVQTLEAVYADPKRVLEDEVELTAPKHRLLRRYTAPVVGEDGAITGRLWTFLDITRTRHMEDKVRAQAAQLKEQSRQLASALKTVTGRLDKAENTLSLTQQQLFETEKLSAVGLLAASVAHDIRNLLTPLMIEVSLADQDDPALRDEALSVMRRQIDGLALLTHRLLALAKPDTQERAPTDLACAGIPNPAFGPPAGRFRERADRLRRLAAPADRFRRRGADGASAGQSRFERRPGYAGNRRRHAVSPAGSVSRRGKGADCRHRPRHFGAEPAAAV